MRVCLFVALFIAGCATTVTPKAETPAALTELDSSLRDKIRSHVRNLIGSDYIVDLEPLMQSGAAKAVDRRRGDLFREGYIPKPAVDFSLVLAGSPSARLCELRALSIDAPPLSIDPDICRTVEYDVIVPTGG